MTNPLLRAVQEYIDNESAYVRDVEGEIQRLERALADERRQTQRRMIAALYWRAGVARHLADVSTVRGQTGRYLQMHDTLVHAARAMEAACAR